MKAIILAGGRGTRLRPITDIVPKPLIPLAGRTIIEWQLEYLRGCGITDCIVSSGYRSRQIENFLRDRVGLGVRIEYSVEDEPLGTGGAIKKAGELVHDDAFVVLNGDVITNIDMRKLLRRTDCIAAVPLRTKFGVLESSGDRVTAFLEKRQLDGAWMNAGVYHLSRGMLADLPERGAIETTTFPQYAERGRLFLERFGDAAWYSIDSHRDMEECSRDVERIVRTSPAGSGSAL